MALRCSASGRSPNVRGGHLLTKTTSPNTLRNGNSETVLGEFRCVGKVFEDAKAIMTNVECNGNLATYVFSGRCLIDLDSSFKCLIRFSVSFLSSRVSQTQRGTPRRVQGVRLYWGGQEFAFRVQQAHLIPSEQQSFRSWAAAAPGEQVSVLCRRHPAPSRGRDALGTAAGTAALLFPPLCPQNTATPSSGLIPPDDKPIVYTR